MARANLNKIVWLVTNTKAASKFIPGRPRISINWNPPFQTSLHKISKEVFFRLTTFFFRNKKILFKEQLLFSFLCIVKQKKILEQSENFWKFLFLKICFDAAVAFLTSQTLLLKLAVAILCLLVAFGIFICFLLHWFLQLSDESEHSFQILSCLSAKFFF